MEKSQKRLILFMPSMDGGGVEKNLILISNYLSRYINNITLITFDNKFNKYFSRKIKILNVKKNTTKPYSKYSKYFFCLLLLAKKIFFERKKYLVFSFQANIYCIILSKILNFDTIVRSNSSPKGWTKSYIKNLIFKIFFKYTKKVIVNSYEFKSQIDKQFNTNSAVIYNPLNKKEIQKLSKHKVRLKNFFSKKTLNIINVARFTDQKDHITLLKSLKMLNEKINVKLLLIGYGPNKVKIENYIKNYNLLKNVKILSFQKNIYKYINISDIFVLTSIFEGLPNVILEAMTLKKYVISTNCPTGPNEILNNGKYGTLFKLRDYKNLARKILKYYYNKKIYNKKIKAAYKSLNRFDFNKNCEKYLLIIKGELQLD